MAELRSTFLREIVARRFLHQCTDLEGLDEVLQGGPVPAYIGFDLTADSLHVGSLVQIMLLRHLQKSGHKPIVLMGGGTTRIGDPSGKDTQRQMLDDETIARNKTGIFRVFEKFLTFGDGPTDAVVVDNAEWLDELRYIPLLRDVGRHFSINRMLTFDSVRLRLEREQPLTFLEFNYMILQAYDFVELSKRYGCSLQMGGSDQWGNIVNGVELGRRMADQQLFGLTVPLITTANGVKMGKTQNGAIWLNEDRLSPYDYWQFWRNTADADVGRFLRLFTELSLEEIARLENLSGAEINDAKKQLANEATALAHSREAAEAAARTAAETFEQKQHAQGLPTHDLTRAEVEAGLGLIDLIRLTGLAATNGEARRLVRNRGARLNGEAVEDEKRQIAPGDFDESGVAQLSSGKKRHVLLRLAD